MTMNSIPKFVQSALERKLPPKTDYGIAFVGCGGIVNYGHIPSYQANGFNLIGGYDRNPEAAERTALYSNFRVLGNEGVIEGTIGTNYNYPNGRQDTIAFTSRNHPEQNFSATLPGKWIPDAFYGPMASLMEAIQTNGSPITSAEDNLGTLHYALWKWYIAR
jgi:predicted dehydrogenase